MTTDPYNIACNHGFIQSSCSDCNLKGLCLPIAMDIKDIDKVDNIIKRSRPIQPENIFTGPGMVSLLFLLCARAR